MKPMDIDLLQGGGLEALPTTLTKEKRQASDAKEALHGRQPMFYMLLKVVNNVRVMKSKSTLTYT